MTSMADWPRNALSVISCCITDVIRQNIHHFLLVASNNYVTTSVSGTSSFWDTLTVYITVTLKILRFQSVQLASVVSIQYRRVRNRVRRPNGWRDGHRATAYILRYIKYRSYHSSNLIWTEPNRVRSFSSVQMIWNKISDVNAPLGTPSSS